MPAQNDLQQTITHVEKDLLNLILHRVENKNMSPTDAQNLAKEFLSFLPIKDQHDLLLKLHKLSQDNNATQELYLKYAKPYEENEAQRRLTLMSHHLHKGDIEQALSIAKGTQK